MSDTVIQVENLGKKYIIGHQKQERYTTFRDVIANGVKSVGSKITKSFGKKESNPAFEEFWALNDISFEIKQGDRVGIIGRNGAGKSTLLKILSRITEPTKGRIKIKGRVASLLEVGTGFHPELTGRENIFLNGAILGMSKEEIKRKFDEIVAFAEVEKFLDTPVKRYSSGMYVRLAFAVAAHLEPEILIVDEVLAVGDSKFQEKCLGKMKNVGDRGSTVLFVSHQMGTIAQLCNQAILLERGVVAEQGYTQNVISHYLKKISSNENNGFLVSNKETKNKDLYLSNIQTTDTKGVPTCEFGHTDGIILKVDCTVNKYLSGVVLATSVKDRLGRRVFSSQTELNISENDKDINSFTSSMKIPEKLLTPGQYCFFIIVHIPRLQVLDTVDDVCFFNISDTGSEFAEYEGSDYGCVFVNCKWNVQFN